MKIIIAGDGKVGGALTRQLSSEGYDITLIDINPEVLENAMERFDVITVQGNGASMGTLDDAGVEDADLLIAVTGEDEVNLLSCLTAHGMNPKINTIARIRNPEYAQQAYRMQSLFGLSMIVNPERFAASEIARLIRFPGFLKIDTFAKGRVELVELKIDKDSQLCNVALSEISRIVRCRVLVATVLRAGEVVAPDGSFVLRENDRIFVAASNENLSILLKNLGIITRKARRVMLAGGGRVSYYLAQQLLKDGIDVVILEQDPDRCVELADALPKATVVCGDAGNTNFMENEGIGEADALVTATGLDELNLVLSLYARSKKVPQVITKLGRMTNEDILNELPIGSTISPKELCSERILRYVRALKNQTGAAVAVHKLADNKAEAIEFRVDDTTHHLKEPLRTVRTKENVLVAAISRDDKTEIPNGDSFLMEGDRVVIICNGDRVMYSLNDIFED